MPGLSLERLEPEYLARAAPDVDVFRLQDAAEHTSWQIRGIDKVAGFVRHPLLLPNFGPPARRGSSLLDAASTGTVIVWLLFARHDNRVKG